VDASKIDGSFIAGLGEEAVNDGYRAPDRGLRAHAGSQGRRRGSGGQPAGGELDGHEVRSGPGRFLYFETALGTEAAGTLVATNPAREGQKVYAEKGKTYNQAVNTANFGQAPRSLAASHTATNSAFEVSSKSLDLRKQS
jgi:hypothetical protein